MQTLNPYVFFDGNCAEAMRFYERVLDAKIEMMMTHAESPIADQLPPGNGNRILHAALLLKDGMLMASDTMKGDAYEGMKGFSVSLSYADATEANRIFAALSEGGRVTMPIEATFWAEAFGMLVDKFGLSWMVSGGMPKS